MIEINAGKEVEEPSIHSCVTKQGQLALYSTRSLSLCSSISPKFFPFSAETFHILKQLCRVFMDVKVGLTNYWKECDLRVNEKNIWT
jgi:hypothetical protein